VTYDPVGGIKPLITLDYAPDITTGSPFLNNVGVGTPQTVTGDTTVNSIKIVDPNGSIVIESGTLTVNSGMMLAAASSTNGISGAGTLAFASGMDGIIAGDGNLTISTNITSPAPFIKAGTGKLTLSGNNSLSTVYISADRSCRRSPARWVTTAPFTLAAAERWSCRMGWICPPSICLCTTAGEF